MPDQTRRLSARTLIGHSGCLPFRFSAWGSSSLTTICAPTPVFPVVLKAGAAPNALSAKAHVRPVKPGLGRRAFQLPDGRWVIKDRYRQPDDQAAAEADKDVTVLGDAEFKAERRRVAASGGDD